jgi:titin
MPRLTLASLTLSVSAALLMACDGNRPFDPSTADEATGSAARGGGDGSDLAPPSNAGAVAQSDTRIEVRWEDNSSTETAFEVHRSTSGAGGKYAIVATTSANAVAHDDPGLEPSSEYCYKVRAVRVNGSRTSRSAFSNHACALTLATAPLAAPSEVIAVAVSDDQIALTWQDNSSAESGFFIVRSDQGETGYFAGMALTAPNAVTFSDLTVRADSRYCYKVHAAVGHELLDANGVPNGYSFSSISPASNISCATVPPFTAVPAAAADVTAMAENSSTVAIRWRANSTSGEGFRLYRSTDDGQLWTLLVSTSGVYAANSVLAFSDVGRNSEQRVCYRVVAFNSAGDAPPSSTACTVPPASPSELTAVRSDAQTVAFTWRDNSAAEETYEVWVNWTSPYRCDGPACNADVTTGCFRLAELPANATSFRCAACTEPAWLPDEGEWGFLTVMSVFAVKDGGKSSIASIIIP